MKKFFDAADHLATLRHLAVSILLVLPLAALAGSASAGFLWALEACTRLRWEHGWLLFLLPVGGFAVGWVYHVIGRDAEKGSNLIIEEIHRPGGGVPARMAPLVLIGTLLTHLFGGSAGREGTAVQMAGSLAGTYARLCRVSAGQIRVLLMAGIAAGFASVFGTPLTGAVFAMEVLVIGRMQYDALLPVLVAAVVGDLTCSAWGIHHTPYHIAVSEASGTPWHLDLRLLGLTIVAAVAFGWASRVFVAITHTIKDQSARFISYPPLRPVLGGLVVIALVYLVGTRDFLGIGVTSPDPKAVTILSAFEPGGATPWSWWWKLLFTAVTLGTGFKGGEVTPLFFIGAALGHALAVPLGVPVDLFAGLGFIAVFAGATNTPLACTLMGIELFGGHFAVYFAVACFIAYVFSGKKGVYSAQLPGVPKAQR